MLYDKGEPMKEFDDLKLKMLKGFNTWYNNSMLTHVLLPEGIAVSLGFKFYNTGKVLKESLIGRFGENVEEIHPGPRSYDGGYTELKLNCSDHELIIQSAVLDDNQYLLVTPVINGKRPPALLVSSAILWNKNGCTLMENGRLLARVPGREIEIFTDGKPERQMNTGFTNPWLSLELSGPVAISTNKKISAAELKPLMEKQKKLVLDGYNQYGKLSEAYNAMRTCLAWDTIYEPEKDQICSPVSRLWNINWGGYVLFDWDTYFSAYIASVENRDIAYANAIAVTHEKTEAGFVPNCGAADDAKSLDRSQPPVGSMVVKELYRKYRDKWLIEYLFEDLLVWNRWFAHHRMLPNGQLCWGTKPYEGKNGKHWETAGVGDTFGAAMESGLDNSTMYDDVPFNKTTHMMEQADVGFTGLYIMDCEALAELADLIGRKESTELRERAEKSKQGLEEMWDEEFGLYCNKRCDTGAFSHRLSATNFYALFSDTVSGERVERMMKEHFYNRSEFFGEYMIPMSGRNDPGYNDQNYWRGRIWAPTNFLAYLALRKAGQKEPCKVLAEKGLNLIMKEWTEKGHVHENFNADTGEGCDVQSSDKFYHWGGLLSLIGLMDAGYVEGPEKPLVKSGRTG
jgi:neutral trehalase